MRTNDGRQHLGYPENLIGGRYNTEELRRRSEDNIEA
jgi:hypothetical protein